MAYKTKFDGSTDTTIKLGGAGNPTSIEGYFLGTKEIPDQGYGPGKLHIFQTQEGTVGVWGKTNSNRLLTSDIIGQMVLLSFTGMGEKKKGKNPAYNYSVQHDPENTTDVSGVNLNAQEPESSEDDGEPEAQQEPVATKYTATKTQGFNVSSGGSLTVGGSGSTGGSVNKPAVNSDAQAKLQAMLNKRKSA